MNEQASFMKNQKGFAPIIIILIVFIGMGGYFGYKYFLPVKSTDRLANTTSRPIKPIEKPTTTPFPTDQGSVSEGDNTGWLKYTNLSKGYSVQFPSNVYKRKPCVGEELLLIPTDLELSTSYSECNRDTSYNFEIRTLGTNEVKTPTSDQYYSVKTESVNVVGKAVTTYTSTLTVEPDPDSMAPLEWVKVAYITNGSKSHKVQITDTENEKLFDQILSTFKFTDGNDQSKFCSNDSDCELLTCSGCFNQEYLKFAPPDLACRTYEGYNCSCVNNICSPSR